MYYKKAIVSFAIVSLYSVQAAYYEASDYSTPQYIINNDSDENPDRFISLYSGYFTSQHNVHDLTTFGIELLNAGDCLLHKIEDNPVLRNVGLGIFSYIYYVYQLTLHEVGHGLRIKAHKRDYQLNLASDNRKFSKDECFWKYFVRSLFNANLSGNTTYYPLKRDTKNLAKEKLIVAAGGINSETYLAERIANAIWEEQLHGNLPIAAYMWARLSPMLYTFNSSTSKGNDINNMVTSAETLGVNLDKSNLQTAYSLALIGGTAYSMICHLASNHDDIDTVTFHNFRIPDIFPYVTSYGLSYKFVSGYKISSDILFNFSYERIFKKNKKHEFSLGISGKFNVIDIGSNVYFGCSGFGFDATVSMKLTAKLNLNCRVASYPAKGLMGERHARYYYQSRGLTDDSDKQKTRNNMLSVGLSYWYGR